MIKQKQHTTKYPPTDEYIHHSTKQIIKYYSAILLPFAAMWIDLEWMDFMLTEISQTEISVVCITSLWNLKRKQMCIAKLKQIYKYRKQMSGEQQRKGRGERENRRKIGVWD